MIDTGQKWQHNRGGRTVHIEATDGTQNGFVAVTNVTTGRASRLRKSTLLREYRIVTDGAA